MLQQKCMLGQRGCDAYKGSSAHFFDSSRFFFLWCCVNSYPELVNNIVFRDNIFPRSDKVIIERLKFYREIDDANNSGRRSRVWDRHS